MIWHITNSAPIFHYSVWVSLDVISGRVWVSLEAVSTVLVWVSIEVSNMFLWRCCRILPLRASVTMGLSVLGSLITLWRLEQLYCPLFLKHLGLSPLPGVDTGINVVQDGSGFDMLCPGQSMCTIALARARSKSPYSAFPFNRSCEKNNGELFLSGTISWFLWCSRLSHCSGCRLLRVLCFVWSPISVVRVEVRRLRSMWYTSLLRAWL